MTESDKINAMSKKLKELSLSSDYNFISISESYLSGSYREKALYDQILSGEIEKLAKASELKWHNDSIYIFNGKIYVPVKNDIVEYAFRVWLRDLRLVPKNPGRLFKDHFVATLRMFNALAPRLDIVAFTNGVLDLNDFTLNPFDEKYHVTYYHPYPYDPKAQCPKWAAFLREVLPDKVQRTILQMFLGLGLIERGSVMNPFEGRDKSKVELCLILIGGGANGKSVVYRTAVGLFGSDRICGVDYDELTSGGDEGMRARRLMRDAIFNWSSDSDSRNFGRKRTGVFKRIVSGEPVTDRAIGGNVEQNWHLPYLVFNLNELPYPEENNLGFIRRLQFVSFDVTIPKTRQNPALAQELVKEYPGIFNWVLRGMREVRRKHFVFPSSEAAKRQQMLAQVTCNPTMAWINAYGVRPKADVPGELYEWVDKTDVERSIGNFCMDNDVEMPTNQGLGRCLSSMGFMKKRGGDGVTRYKMYGGSLESIRRRITIRDAEYEEMKLRDERETFINEED